MHLFLSASARSRSVKRWSHAAVATLVVACLVTFPAYATSNRAAPNPDLGALPGSSAPDAAARTQIKQAYGKLPISFEANRGQTDPQVDFLSRGTNYSLFLTST